MICKYRVHYSNGENQDFKCSVFQLKKKVAEKFTNIPIDQIVLIDKDNKLFDLNKGLTQTQIFNPNTEQIYILVDLQKLILEWSQIKITNDSQSKTIDKLQKEINELKDQIERNNQEQLKNQTESQKNNNTIIQLRDDLEKYTKQFSQERQQLQDKITNLRSKLSDDTNSFEQQIKNYENSVGDLSEQLKNAVDKIKNQEDNIQQLNTQILERDNKIQNTIQQSQSYQYQLQQSWQQHFNNYQSQAQQQKQADDLKILELTEEKEQLDKKLKTEKKLNFTITQERNDFETQLNAVQLQYKTLQANLKKLQLQLDNIRQEQENLETEKNKVAKVGENVTLEAQKIKQELSRLKVDYSNLQFEKEQVQNDFESFKQQHTLFANQAQATLQTATQEHEEEVKSFNTKINQLNNEINYLKKQLSDAIQQIKVKDSKIEHIQQEYSKSQQQLDQLSSVGNSLGLQKKNLESTSHQLENDLKEARTQYEAEKVKYRAAENEKTQLKGELQQKDIELTSEKTNHEATKREKNQYQDQCKKMADQFKELQQQTTNEVQRLTIQVQVAEKKIERVLQNFGETKIFEKITGPLDKIMASEYKISRFTEDPNSQSDNAQYNLIEIGLQFDKYTQFVKEGKFFLIDECFQYGNKINITATRSIQANAESEFYKGYLIKIIESPQADLKTKTLLRKDLKLQNLAFQNKEEAARLAVNNIFCLWIQNQLNKDLATAKLQPQKQTIQRQFILENEAKKEFYYCEMVEEGPFQKINGGKFVPQKDDIHQYFNALSLYSYKMFEQQMILTNFQVCGNYVYDMIVHTNHKGLFSPLDQGPPESITFIEILSKQPADIMSKSWNEAVKQQAEKYLRG